MYDTFLSQIYIYVADTLNEMAKVTAVTRQVMIYFFLNKYNTQGFEVSGCDLQRSRIAHKFGQMRRFNLRIKLAFTFKVVF